MLPPSITHALSVIFQRETGSLFDEQQGNAALAQAGNDGKNVFNHLRREAHRGFVEDQQCAGG